MNKSSTTVANTLVVMPEAFQPKVDHQQVEERIVPVIHEREQVDASKRTPSDTGKKANKKNAKQARKNAEKRHHYFVREIKRIQEEKWGSASNQGFIQDTFLRHEKKNEFADVFNCAGKIAATNREMLMTEDEANDSTIEIWEHLNDNLRIESAEYDESLTAEEKVLQEEFGNGMHITEDPGFSYKQDIGAGYNGYNGKVPVIKGSRYLIVNRFPEYRKTVMYNPAF